MPTALPPLSVNQIYTWIELGKIFDFQPQYLNRVEGIVSRPEFGSILLITHPGGGERERDLKIGPVRV